MFNKRKEPASPISAAGTEKNAKAVKKKRPRREKCANCKRCWGFFDFLKTSWKLFKEFSADTSIHGWNFQSFHCQIFNFPFQTPQE